MSDTLQRGAKGPAVKAIQVLLNRNGAFVGEDGDFGGGTDTAVREFQALAGLPVTGILDDATNAKLAALPEPCPDASTEAIYFIIREEAGDNRSVYDRLYSRPTVPGDDSGVTIGVGYDLGQEKTFESDWGNLLTPQQMQALRPWVGKQGWAAAGAAQQLANVSVPWPCAWKVFIGNNVPTYLVLCRKTFANFDQLPLPCQGALLSLVFNRGPGMEDSPPGSNNRKEMREIRDAMTARNWAAVPGYLRDMQRLWPGNADLIGRRGREAAMFEQGLQQADAPQS